jgi:hypothetical protein
MVEVVQDSLYLIMDVAGEIALKSPVTECGQFCLAISGHKPLFVYYYGRLLPQIWQKCL